MTVHHADRAAIESSKVKACNLLGLGGGVGGRVKGRACVRAWVQVCVCEREKEWEGVREGGAGESVRFHLQRSNEVASCFLLWSAACFRLQTSP